MDPFGVFIEVYNLFTSPKPPYKVGKNNLENSRALMTLSRSFWRRLGPSGARGRLRACSRAFPAARDSSGTFERFPDASPRAPCAPCPLPARASVAHASVPRAPICRARPLVCLPPLRARARASLLHIGVS